MATTKNRIMNYKLYRENPNQLLIEDSVHQ